MHWCKASIDRFFEAMHNPERIIDHLFARTCTDWDDASSHRDDRSFLQNDALVFDVRDTEGDTPLV